MGVLLHLLLPFSALDPASVACYRKGGSAFRSGDFPYLFPNRGILNAGWKVEIKSSNYLGWKGPREVVWSKPSQSEADFVVQCNLEVS